jgi:hypothetical protein
MRRLVKKYLLIISFISALSQKNPGAYLYLNKLGLLLGAEKEKKHPLGMSKSIENLCQALEIGLREGLRKWRLA